jgi:pimeloyl-ACP methyl ester carboxylesterase
MKSSIAFFLLALLLLIANSVAAQDRPTHPVVLIPGILGTKLCAADGKVLWGQSARSSLSNFHLLEVTAGNGGIKPCGIIDDVQVLGPLYSVAAYSSLLKAMREWQFVERRNLFIFDYDWRLSNVDNAAALERFVLSELGPDREFNIIAHSMGGLIARLYVDRQRARSPVKKIIYLGTPFLGSMSTLGTLSEGWGRIPNWLAGGVEGIRRVAMSFPSLLELLPRYDNCCTFKDTSDRYRAIDVFDPQLWKVHAWLPVDMRQGPRFDQFSSNLRRAASLSTVLRSPGQGVIEVRFASDSRSTRFIFTAREGQTNPSADNWHFSFERGDATVPAWSAARDTTLSSLASTLQSFGEHSTIFDDDWVRSELKRELFTALAVLDRPIAGKGYPTIEVTIGGQRREWSLEQLRVTPRETYITAGTPFEAEVALKFSGNARDFTSGAYKPRVLLRHGGATMQLDVVETTTAVDEGNRLLTFKCQGETQGLSEGVVELAVELPASQPPSGAKEFVVVLR